MNWLKRPSGQKWEPRAIWSIFKASILDGCPEVTWRPAIFTPAPAISIYDIKIRWYFFFLSFFVPLFFSFSLFFSFDFILFHKYKEMSRFAFVRCPPGEGQREGNGGWLVEIVGRGGKSQRFKKKKKKKWKGRKKNNKFHRIITRLQWQRRAASTSVGQRRPTETDADGRKVLTNSFVRLVDCVPID